MYVARPYIHPLFIPLIHQLSLYDKTNFLLFLDDVALQFINPIGCNVTNSHMLVLNIAKITTCYFAVCICFLVKCLPCAQGGVSGEGVGLAGRNVQACQFFQCICKNDKWVL